MKNSSFILIVIATHIVFVVAHVHRHTQFIKQSFRLQRNEQIRLKLEQKRQHLVAQIHALQDLNNVKRYAQNRLGMQPIGLGQVKQFPQSNDECDS